MVAATSVEEILPGVFRWERWSPEHKVVLSSHAARQGSEFLIFDPIEVSVEVLDGFPPAPPTAIVLTSTNHLRAAVTWRDRFRVPVFASAEAKLGADGVQSLATDQLPFKHWRAMPLPGGPAGELAFFLPAMSLLIFGDAVVNLEGRGLELLPAKYCVDQIRLRESVRRLTREFVALNAVFAHGAPLLGDASARLATLL